jgi:hypothetical protein
MTQNWGNRSKGYTAGAWDPNKFNGDETTVFSAADKTRNKILDMVFNMNDKVSTYLQYRKAGKMPAFANEEAQRTVQELYSLVRESIITWMIERQSKLTKRKNQKTPDMVVIKQIEDELIQDRLILSGLDQLDAGANARDDFLVKSKRFLNSYVYNRGISKLEIENKDPIDDYAKKAYGNKYNDDENE